MDSLQPNPHITLTVAAWLAHRQLTVKPNEFYDVEHFSALMNRMAQALMSVAQIHVADADGAEWRALTEAELEGASVRRGATRLVLADGRTYRHSSVLRDDLRRAITIFAGTGLKFFGAQRTPK